MSSRKLKKAILGRLAKGNLDESLAFLGHHGPGHVVNVLFSAICREEQAIRWHAVSCMGVTLNRLAVQDMEAARVVMRRMLWSLNDESGGIGWGAPESLAEAMYLHAGLAKEYIHMLISYMRQDGDELLQDGNFLEHPILQRGLLWGVARLSERRQDLLLKKGAGNDILAYLASPDQQVRGLAALALGRLKLSMARSELKALVEDTEKMKIYEEGSFVETSVGRLAEEALEALGT